MVLLDVDSVTNSGDEFVVENTTTNTFELFDSDGTWLLNIIQSGIWINMGLYYQTYKVHFTIEIIGSCSSNKLILNTDR